MKSCQKRSGTCHRQNDELLAKRLVHPEAPALMISSTLSSQLTTGEDGEKRGYLANSFYSRDGGWCWTDCSLSYLLVTALWYSMNVRPSKAMASVSPADFSWMAVKDKGGARNDERMRSHQSIKIQLSEPKAMKCEHAVGGLVRWPHAQG